MENLSLSLLTENTSLLWILESLLNGTLVLGLIALAMLALRPLMSPTTAHLVWLAGMIGMAMSMLTPLIDTVLPQTAQNLAEVSLFTLTSTSGARTAEVGALPWGVLLLFAYAMVTALLLLRIGLSFTGLLQLRRGAEPVLDPELAMQCERLQATLGIDREVHLASTTAAVSPMSFGLMTPTILVPADFRDWPEDLRGAVLAHELSHIRRLDWLSLLFANLLCALFWLNPMTWLAKRCLDDESEKACDSAMVLEGRERSDCAASLLELARSRQTALSRPLLAQQMVGKSALGQRVSHLLEGRLNSRLSRRLLAALALPIILMVSLGHQLQVVAAQDELADQEYVPIRAEAPQYPRRAADEEVEGWTLFGFTVTPEGRVDPASIELLDEEPAGYFERTSRRALEGFEFRPRIVDGEAVSVAGVQYLFRFQLDDGGYRNELERSPPPPRR